MMLDDHRRCTTESSAAAAYLLAPWIWNVCGITTSGSHSSIIMPEG